MNELNITFSLVRGKEPIRVTLRLTVNKFLYISIEKVIIRLLYKYMKNIH